VMLLAEFVDTEGAAANTGSERTVTSDANRRNMDHSSAR